MTRAVLRKGAKAFHRKHGGKFCAERVAVSDSGLASLRLGVRSVSEIGCNHTRPQVPTVFLFGVVLDESAVRDARIMLAALL